MDIVTVGLFLGDEGKGSIVDFLTYSLSKNIVRYGGGSQCAHNVMANGIHHTFSQFGSNLFSDSKILLTQFMIFDPLELIAEADDLQKKGILNPYEKVYVSEDCLVITPFQKICGQARELARSEKHGTCGKGVGETIKDSLLFPQQVIRIKDLDSKNLVHKLNVLRTIKLDQIEQLPETDQIKERLSIFREHEVEGMAKAIRELAYKINIVSGEKLLTMIQESDNVWEGAQGSLLDPNFGFPPFVTKTNTTVQNAAELLTNKKFLKLGIMRAYATRHGNGPFPTEDKSLNLEESHNQNNEWQGNFRQGHLDLVLTKYAVAMNKGIDEIALTCVDKLSGQKEIKVCLAYDYTGKESQELIEKYFDCDKRNRIVGIKVQKQDETISKLLMDCQPIYASLLGWQTDISKVTEVNNLPKQVVELINFIEKQLSVSINLISVGPDRSQKMFLKI